MTARRLVPLLAITALAACGSDDDTGTDDVGVDVAVDTALDTADGSDDASPDVADDTAPDAVADVPPDTPPDVAPDTAPDVAPDTPPDTGDACPPDDPAFTTWVDLTIPIDGQAIFTGTWDGRENIPYLIDTGAQITSFDVDLTDGNVSFFQADTMFLGTTTYCGATIKGRDLAEAEAYIGVDIGALLGQTVLKHIYTYVDYQNARGYLYRTEPTVEPPGRFTSAATDLPYVLQNELPVATIGLGNGDTVDLLTDTGSGVTIVTQSHFDELEAALESPLPRLEGYVWATNYGTDDAFITRLPVLELSGAVVEGEWAVVIPDDYHIRALLEGSSVFVDGFLGYPAYRHFLLEVRGPDSMFRLWPYGSDDHIDVGEWHRVGIELVQRDVGPRVEMIFRPSDAAEQDINIGDVVRAVDGTSVADMNLDEIRRLLHGTPGDTIDLELQVEGAGPSRLVTVAIDDLLPPL